METSIFVRVALRGRVDKNGLTLVVCRHHRGGQGFLSTNQGWRRGINMSSELYVCRSIGEGKRKFTPGLMIVLLFGMGASMAKLTTWIGRRRNKWKKCMAQQKKKRQMKVGNMFYSPMMFCSCSYLHSYQIFKGLVCLPTINSCDR